MSSLYRTDPRSSKSDLYEAGVKLAKSNVALYLTGFLTKFDSQSFGETRFDPATNSLVSRTEFASTETYGFEVEGTVRVRDLDAEYGIQFPDGGFETLAGFLLLRLGAIPTIGDSVEHEGRRYTVLEMDRNRIARVRIEKLAAAKG